jgi:hypothetical protein
METRRGHNGINNINGMSAMTVATIGILTLALAGCGGSESNQCNSNAISTRQVTGVATGQEALELVVNSVSAAKSGNKIALADVKPLVGARYEVRKEMGNQLVVQGTIRANEVIRLDAKQVSPGDMLTVMITPPEAPAGKSAYGTDADGLGILRTQLAMGQTVRTTVNYVAGGWDGTGQVCGK